MVVIVLDLEKVKVQGKIDDRDVSWISLARLVLQFPTCLGESSGFRMTMNMKRSKRIAVYVKSIRHQRKHSFLDRLVLSKAVFTVFQTPSVPVLHVQFASSWSGQQILGLCVVLIPHSINVTAAIKLEVWAD